MKTKQSPGGAARESVSRYKIMMMPMSTSVEATPQFYWNLLGWWRTQDSGARRKYLDHGLNEDEIKQFATVEHTIDHFTPRELRAYLITAFTNHFWFSGSSIPALRCEWNGETQDWTLHADNAGSFVIATVPGNLTDEVLLKENSMQMAQFKDLLRPLAEIYS